MVHLHLLQGGTGKNKNKITEIIDPFPMFISARLYYIQPDSNVMVQ